MIIKSQILAKNKDFFQDFFEKKYNLENLEKNYFSYLDYENFFLLQKKELLELEILIKKINQVFLKAYNFYFEDLEKNNQLSFMKFFLKNKIKKADYLIGRYDILIEKNTGIAKFIEFNSNVPGMITDIYDISSFQRPKGFLNLGKRFVNYIKKKFEKYKDKKIGILLTHSFSDEDYLVCLDYKDIISKVLPKENIIIGDIYESNIVNEKFFTLKGQKIDILLNFFPLEFFLTDENFGNNFFEIIHSGNLKIFNSIESICFQDKLIFAIIWENISKFSQTEQEIIKKHIPFTTRLLPEKQEDFLAKYRFGRIGKNVYSENFTLNIDKIDDFIFQEKINSETLENGDFVVFGAFTDLKKLISIVGRKQKALITNDENSKAILSFVEKF